MCAWLSCLFGSPNISPKPGAKRFREYQLVKFDHGYVNVVCMVNFDEQNDYWLVWGANVV